MANSRQALKRARQAVKHRANNRWQVSRMTTQLKLVIHSIAAGETEKAQAAYPLACSLLDRLANKGIIHKNKAARHKSRLGLQIKKLSEVAA